MKNKGYTIMEAVIAMFLLVVMVGAVFSALMSGRRAIITSSEREEVFYSLNSVYGMLKDCRSNPNCHLKTLGCNYSFALESNQGLKGCDELFTYTFGNLCQGATSSNSVGTFQFNVRPSDIAPSVWLYDKPGQCSNEAIMLQDFYVLDIQASCDEGD
jgi:type II secretory pathway component PulJ